MNKNNSMQSNDVSVELLIGCCRFSALKWGIRCDKFEFESLGLCWMEPSVLLLCKRNTGLHRALTKANDWVAAFLFGRQLARINPFKPANKSVGPRAEVERLHTVLTRPAGQIASTYVYFFDIKQYQIINVI